MKPCATLKPTFVATQSLQQHTANGHSKIGTFVDFSSAAEVASICKDRKRFGGLFQRPCKGARAHLSDLSSSIQSMEARDNRYIQLSCFIADPIS